MKISIGASYQSASANSPSDTADTFPINWIESFLRGSSSSWRKNLPPQHILHALCVLCLLLCVLLCLLCYTFFGPLRLPVCARHLLFLFVWMLLRLLICVFLGLFLSFSLLVPSSLSSSLLSSLLSSLRFVRDFSAFVFLFGAFSVFVFFPSFFYAFFSALSLNFIIMNFIRKQLWILCKRTVRRSQRNFQAVSSNLFLYE